MPINTFLLIQEKPKAITLDSFQRLCFINALLQVYTFEYTCTLISVHMHNPTNHLSGFVCKSVRLGYHAIS